MLIIDAQIHCGDNRQTKYYSLAEVERDLAEAGAGGAVLFAFPEDMYRLVDTPEARRRANEYVLECARTREHLYPFYFVWNDYVLPERLGAYAGIKWHRHADEPPYDYEAPGCEAALEAIRALRLPITLEEEWTFTRGLVERLDGHPIIIPHMGMLNGGYQQMAPFFALPYVYFDTAVAPPEAIGFILEQVGAERVLFGSDVSGTAQPFFNFPKVESAKLAQLQLSPEEREAVLGGNILRLVGPT